VKTGLEGGEVGRLRVVVGARFRAVGRDPRDRGGLRSVARSASPCWGAWSPSPSFATGLHAAMAAAGLAFLAGAAVAAAAVRQGGPG